MQQYDEIKVHLALVCRKRNEMFIPGFNWSDYSTNRHFTVKL